MDALEAVPVLVRRQGRLGRITLNRPASINALNAEMVRLVSDALDRWDGDDSVTCVLLDGAGDRGLCAGGDLRADGADPAEFLRAEFTLDARIASSHKPVLAWMDGITMGGGVGISAHSSLRIVTERSRVAMPETRIALSPDVGGTFLLSRAPGLLGIHLGLTSATMNGSDAIAAGFADLLAPAAAREALAAEIAGGADPREAAERLAVAPERSMLVDAREWIDHCYAADTLPEVVRRLRQAGAAARAAADTIMSFSPTATSVAFAAIRRASALTLRECLSMEFMIMLDLADREDVRQGIRATLGDRSYVPRWRPARLDEVEQSRCEQLVRRVPDPPLW